MQKAGQRLKETRLKLGLTQQELGDTLGFPWHKIKDIETGRLKLSAEIASLIGEKYSIDGWWLLTGKGSMYPEVTPVQAEVQKNIHNVSKDVLSIPLVAHSAQAGAGNDISNIKFEIVETMSISKSLFKTPPSSMVRVIRVEGYSMVPMLYPDSYCLFDECGEFKTDGLYIINYDDQLMVKLLQINPADNTLDIISTNKDYRSYSISPKDQSVFRIIGKVLRVII